MGCRGGAEWEDRGDVETASWCLYITAASFDHQIPVTRLKALRSCWPNPVSVDSLAEALQTAVTIVNTCLYHDGHQAISPLNLTIASRKDNLLQKIRISLWVLRHMEGVIYG